MNKQDIEAILDRDYRCHRPVWTYKVACIDPIVVLAISDKSIVPLHVCDYEEWSLASNAKRKLHFFTRGVCVNCDVEYKSARIMRLTGRLKL